MSGSLRGNGLLARRVRDVLAVCGQRSSHLHPPTSTHSTPQSFLHPPPLSFHSSTRQLCFQRSASLYFPFHPSAPQSSSLSPSSPSALFSTSPMTLKIKPKVDGDAPEKKRKVDNSAQITLIDGEDKVSQMSLHEAERLAKRRDYKLVKIEDPSLRKGSKDVYRLMTGREYFEEQMKEKKSEKKSKGAKDVKVLALGGKITSHDLAIKLQNVTKWLNKGHQIKVTISSKKATKPEMEEVFSTVEEEVKKVKGRILQRHEKMDDIRFYVAPPKPVTKATNSKTTQGDDSVQSDGSSDQSK